jgi:type I restriction enzyme, S subunit
MNSLPIGWKTSPLGRIAQIVMGQSPESKYYSEEENGLPFLQGCADFQARFPRHAVFCSQIKKSAPQNSILFSVRAPVGRLNIADRSYIIGRGLSAIIGIEIDQDYLEQYLHFEELSFRNASQGSTFEAINSAELSNFQVIHPIAKPEQTKIAEILSTVDRAIEQTEGLIAKQQRIKTGLMQDLLTRGIDEHGNLRSEKTHKFKDSPLGRIPVEWEVKKVGNVFDTQLGKMLNQKAKDGENPAYYLGNKNVQWEQIDSTLLEWMDFSKRERERFSLRKGDILVCEGGEVGRSCVWQDQIQDCFYQKAIHRLRTKGDYISELFPKFMKWAIGCGFLADYTSQTSIAHLTKEKLDDLWIIVPKYNEQIRIHNAFKACDLYEQQVSIELIKLRALKTALMQDLLTGTVRVTPLLEKMEAAS